MEYPGVDSDRCRFRPVSIQTGVDSDRTLSPHAHAGRLRRRPRARGHRPAGEKDAKLAQKSGQIQPFIAVFPQECTDQHLLGQPDTLFARGVLGRTLERP